MKVVWLLRNPGYELLKMRMRAQAFRCVVMAGEVGLADDAVDLVMANLRSYVANAPMIPRTRIPVNGSIRVMTRIRRYYRPIKDETIISILLHLKAEIERDDLEGVEHVDALLRLKNFNPDSEKIPRKTPRHFKRGELRRLVLEALRDGPLTGKEISEIVHGKQFGLTFKQV